MMHNNNLIVGGAFNMAGGETANFIAAWGGCPAQGACCVNGVAVQLTPGECAAVRGVFHGSGVPSSAVECDPYCPADIAPPGGDGAVSVSDLLKIINDWGACP